MAGVNASSAAEQQPRQAYNYDSLDKQLPLTSLPPCTGELTPFTFMCPSPCLHIVTIPFQT